MKTIEELFNDEILEMMKTEITQAYGNEVLFLGWLDESGMVCKVEPVARGNDECVSFPYEWGMKCHVVIHNHPDGQLSPSGADISIASTLAQWGIGFYIVDNSLSNVYVAVEPVLQKSILAVDVDGLVKLVSEGGKLSQLLDGFEERSGQKEMIRMVSESLNTGSPALIEAGTGIGKSMGYLLPSVSWALKNNKRVVISTATINLQEQLIRKDIPLVKKLLEVDFDYVLMKGRQNYICLRKVEELKKELFTFFDEEDIDQFNLLAEWALKTDDGSLTDLGFIPKSSVWDAVCSETITCLGNKCEFYGRCFFNRVKQKAAKSTLIVTNHHYLIADSSLPPGTGLLPPYQYLVLDEAHKIEDSATSYYTTQIDRYYLMRVLRRFYFNKKREGGFLLYLLKAIPEEERETIDELIDMTVALYGEIQSTFDTIDVFVKDLLHVEKREAELCESVVHGKLLELKEENLNMDEWNGVVLRPLLSIRAGFDRVVGFLEKIKSKINKNEFLIRQIDGYCARFSDISSVLSSLVSIEDRSFVRWVEYKDKSVFYMAMVDVSEVLKETIFRRVKNYILTSATLTVENNFSFIERRIGIENEVMECIFPSPFDYKSQMKIFIPTDAPDPENQAYIQQHAEMIYRFIMLTGGGAFILFTSYKTLNGVVSLIRDKIEERGIRVLVQGERPRYNLLEDFKEDIHSVLMGTESFWEGVDVPGHTLRSVIISKLPFKVPSDPVIKARMDKIASEFGNPFIDYLLPLAVVKMKQGIGRLIRNRRDRGIITILDSRIIRKSYGKVFLNSLPPAELVVDSFENLIKEFNFF